MAESSMKRLQPAILGAALALSLAVALLAGLVYVAGTNADWMHAMLTHHAPSDMTGLPEDEYRPMAEMITSYLAGARDTFQHEFYRDGTGYICFAQHEQQHMADCRALFALCRWVLIVSGALSAVLAYAARRQRRNLRWLLIGRLAGLMVLLLAMAALVIWGTVDFDGLFVLFHQLSFANDLWMLNPATDLLIRLMPTGFFVSYAAIIGGVWLAACAAVAVRTAVLVYRLR